MSRHYFWYRELAPGLERGADIALLILSVDCLGLFMCIKVQSRTA